MASSNFRTGDKKGQPVSSTHGFSKQCYFLTVEL